MYQKKMVFAALVCGVVLLAGYKGQAQEIPLKCHPATDAYNGWRLGTQAYTFRKFSFYEAVDKAALNVSDLTMSMSKLHVPVAEGLLDAPLDDLINTALSSTYEFVEFALVTHLQGIMRGPARDWLNKELGKAITNARVRVAAAGPGACSGEQRKEAAITSDASPLVDFSAQPFKFIHSFAADSLSLVDDPNLGVNRVIRAIAGYVI